MTAPYGPDRRRVAAGYRSAGRAFTLIELLVVVAIIALLIAILLPSLRDAREQAKRTLCLSNLHQLGTAFQAYVNDSGGYPIWVLYAGSYGGYCSWSWGGKTTALDPWRTEADGLFYSRAEDRPMNRMLGPIPQEPDPITDDNQRAELPVYRCPSDGGSWQAEWQGTEELTPVPAYEDVGTSFQLNYHWEPQAAIARESFEEQVAWGARLMRTMAERGSSRFLLLMEDPLDRSIHSRFETMGFHRKWARHNVLMLDGHAVWLHVPLEDLDALPWPHGPEWTVFDERAAIDAGLGR